MLFSTKKKTVTVAPQAPEPISRTVAPSEVETAAAPVRLLSYRVANLQGIGSRERQEDSFAFVNAMDVMAIKRSGLFAVVADGMGGMAGGREASETVLRSLRAGFQAMDRNADLASQLVSSVQNAGQEVFRLLGGAGGSTVVACIFYAGGMYYASVGDSFLYLLREGELLRVNGEHNLLSDRYREAIYAGSMDPSPARADPERAALSMFLGMEEIASPDTLRRPLPLHDGDRILICSDGVAGVIPEEELRLCMLSPTPEETCAALEQSVKRAENPYQDNYTALVIHCGY